jgi:hypothetical protein
MTQKLNTNKGYSDTKEGRPAGNSTYKKLAVQWLNEVRFFNQTFVQVDSFVLRNRQLLIAADRYAQFYKDNITTTLVTENFILFVVTKIHRPINK